MVIHPSEMKVEEKECVRGGEGVAHFVHLADGGVQKNAKLLATITLNPGCSIGYHQHIAETEYFFIVSGTGTVNDEGKEVQVKEGDTVVTGDGAFHSIKNTGTAPLIFTAIIITH